jgi:hypothetical protein
MVTRQDFKLTDLNIPKELKETMDKEAKETRKTVYE